MSRSQWTRKRMNHRLFMLTCLPGHVARQTHEPWTFDERGWTYTTNPVWEAAMLEMDRLRDLYERKVPLSQWGIEVPEPDDPFWGPLGDPAARRARRRMPSLVLNQGDYTADDDEFSLKAGQDEIDAWSEFVRELKGR